MNWQFLSGRSQYSVVAHDTSDMEPVISGVVQELVMGPLLFAIFLDSLMQKLPQ